MIAARTAASPAVLIVSLALVLLPIGLGAQALEPGARVRLTQSSGARHQGILQAIEPDSARLTGTRGQGVAVSLASVERVEVSRGRQRQFWRNFGLTTMASAVAGGGIGAATWTPCEEDGWFSCMFVPESRSQAMLGQNDLHDYTIQADVLSDLSRAERALLVERQPCFEPHGSQCDLDPFTRALARSTDCFAQGRGSD